MGCRNICTIFTRKMHLTSISHSRVRVQSEGLSIMCSCITARGRADVGANIAVLNIARKFLSRSNGRRNIQTVIRVMILIELNHVFILWHCRRQETRTGPRVYLKGLRSMLIGPSSTFLRRTPSKIRSSGSNKSVFTVYSKVAFNLERKRHESITELINVIVLDIIAVPHIVTVRTERSGVIASGVWIFTVLGWMNLPHERPAFF